MKVEVVMDKGTKLSVFPNDQKVCERVGALFRIVGNDRGNGSGHFTSGSSSCKTSVVASMNAACGVVDVGAIRRVSYFRSGGRVELKVSARLPALAETAARNTVPGFVDEDKCIFMEAVNFILGFPNSTSLKKVIVTASFAPVPSGSV